SAPRHVQPASDRWVRSLGQGGRMTWQEDKRRADSYMPHVRAWLGRHLFREATIEEDQRENTDLRILTAKDIRVGVRVRMPETWKRALTEDKCRVWLQEITFRSSRPRTGSQTELQKMILGELGTHFFYGLGQPDGRS